MSGQGRSRIQVLEEDISRVEARIYELEHPEQPASSIQLHDPYDASESRAGAPSHNRRGMYLFCRLESLLQVPLGAVN